MYGNAEKTAQEIHRLTTHRDAVSRKFIRHLEECSQCRCQPFDGLMCNAGFMLKGEFQTVQGQLNQAAVESAGGVT